MPHDTEGSPKTATKAASPVQRFRHRSKLAVSPEAASTSSSVFTVPTSQTSPGPYSSGSSSTFTSPRHSGAPLNSDGSFSGSLTGSSSFLTFSLCSSPKYNSKTFSKKFQELGLSKPTAEQQLSIMRLNHPQDEEDDYELSEAYTTTRLTPDFFNHLRDTTKNFDIFMSFRLQGDALEGLNRRYSLGNGTVVLASPKETDTATKMNPDGMCSGHIPREAAFADKNRPYRLSDNNNPGAYSELCRDAPAGMLEYLQTYVSPNIESCKKLGNLSCFAEKVPMYTKVVDANKDGNKKVSYVPNGQFISKHFAQEPETIFSVIARIESGLYSYRSSSTNEILFIDNHGVNCKLDLTKLTGDIYIPEEIEDEFVYFKGFKDYCFLNHLLDCHGPITYETKPNIYVPVMVHTGKNGFHITGDADPEHISFRADMPREALKVFVGRVDSNESIIAALKELIARLKRTEGPGKNYSSDKYYSKVITPVAESALELYEDNPELLEGIGNSTLYDILVQHAFAHPLHIHGPENLHPGSIPEGFGAILSSYNGEFYITPNERSYVEFLFYDRELLRKQRINVHSHWLVNPESSQELIDSWLDLIEVQALHEAEKGVAEFECYCEMLYNSINRGREYDQKARDLITQRLLTIKSLVTSFGGTHDLIAFPIEVKLNKIYNRHNDARQFLKNILEKDNDEVYLLSARSSSLKPALNV